jgi:hypothetical protein
VTNYTSLVTQLAPSATTTNGNATASLTGTLTSLSVTFSAAPGAVPNSYTVTVMVAGVATSLGCIVTGTATTTCTSNAAVPVGAGQTLNVRVVPFSTPTAVSATWTSTFSWGSNPIS